jgi:ethanolamine-phosphate cytidylyltransferase
MIRIFVLQVIDIHSIFGQWDIDYIIHGDDPCIVDGKNVYETAIEIGKFREIPRTEGVSTTDIVGRMLRLSDVGSAYGKPMASPTSKLDKMARRNRQSKFFFTNRMLRLFSQGFKPPPPNAKVVYIDGAFDLFHAGQISMLEKARELGDYLIVGVYSDELVNVQNGSNYPIMNLNERVLSVLGCKFVDDVVLDAPWEVSIHLIWVESVFVLFAFFLLRAFQRIISSYSNCFLHANPPTAFPSRRSRRR